MTKDEADDIKRYFDVVAERLETQIAVVAEGHGVLNDKIDRVAEQVGRLDGRFGRIEGEIGAMDAKVDRLDGRLDRVEGRIDGLDAKVDGLDAKLDRMASEIRAEIAADRTQSKAEHAETRARMAADRELSKKEHAETRAMIKLSFGQLDDRLTALERGYSDLKTRLEIIEKAHAS